MENSSYSKTRSPARFLAAFLAFVMVLIVMPVLPVGAASVTKKIVFHNLGSDTYMSTWGEELSSYLNQEQSQVGSWAGEQYKFQGDGSNVTVEPNVESAPIRNFSFYFSSEQGVSKTLYYYYGSNEENKQVLSPSGDGFYTAPNFNSGASTDSDLHIIAVKTITVTFTGQSTAAALNIGGSTKTSSPYSHHLEVTGESSELEFSINVSNNNRKTPLVHFMEAGQSNAKELPPTSVVDGKYSYKLTNLTSDCSVEIELVDPLNVTWNTDTSKYTVTASNTVAYGSKSFEFKIVPLTGYEITNVSVREGGVLTDVTSSKNDNNYKYENEDGITSALTIEITATAKKYHITVNGLTDAHPGFTTSLTSAGVDVTHGETYTFTVTVTEGYNAPGVEIKDAEHTMTSSGNLLTYTLRNITKDVTVTFTAKEINKFTVTFPSKTEGYELKVGGETVSGPKTYNYGTNLSIEITVKTGYTGTPIVQVNMESGSRQLSPTIEGSTYRYSYKVTSNADLTVNGLSKQQISWSVEEPDGASISTQLSGTVPYGESFEIRFTLKPGYEVKDAKNIQVNNSGEKYENAECKQSGNTYVITVSDVTTPLNLTITGITQIEYTVTPPTTTKGFEFNHDGRSPIHYGDDYTFTVTVKAGYRLNEVYYTLDGSPTHRPLTASGGQYSITNITGSAKIYVSVTAIKYTVNYRVTSTTTFDEDVVGTSDGVVYTVVYSADTTDNASVFAATETGCTLNLENLSGKVHHKGWKLLGWTNANEKLNDKTMPILNTSKGDMTIDLEAQWAIETNGGENGEESYFFVGLTFQHDASSGKDILNASVHTNLDVTERNGGATVYAYGVVYANQKGVLESLKDGVSASDFTVTGPKNYKQYKGNANVVYVCLDAQNKDYNAYVDEKTNESYTVRVGHAESECSREAFAFVILDIKGIKYVFTSPVVYNGQ